ncbi:MAG: ATP-binding protein, partial [Proteobacteria bacterium]|nr:ATP-binding protein [Pseudomonadota bacterium]
MNQYTFKCEDGIKRGIISDHVLPFDKNIQKNITDIFYFFNNLDNALENNDLNKPTCFVFESEIDAFKWYDAGGGYALALNNTKNNYAQMLNCMVEDKKRKHHLNAILLTPHLAKEIKLPFCFSIRHFNECEIATDILFKAFSKLTDRDIVTPVHELLLNAIEHGNLGISNTEKKELIKNNMLYNVSLSLLNNPLNLKKTVNVKVDRTFFNGCEYLTFYIQDQGSGFDWGKKQTTDETAQNGRGISITHSMVDLLSYNQTGNNAQISFKIN